MKKKLVILLLALLFAFVICSCSSTGNAINTEVLSEADNAFEVFKKQINTERWKEYSRTYNYDSLKKYLVNNSADRNALTSDEIRLLQSGKTNNKRILSYEETEQDIDLYFRVLRSHWGAYYYWGGNERFDQVKAAILNRFEGNNNIFRDDIVKAVHEEMSFIMADHFQFGSGKEARFIDKNDRYWFCYTDHVFYRDESGFYCNNEGLRYYYMGCDNETVSIERRLFRDGTLAYGLVQFAPKGNLHTEDVIRVSVDGEEKELTVSWKESTPFSPDSLRDPDFKLVKEKSLSYIQLRSFDTKWEKKLIDFQDSGSKVRGSKLIVFDIMSNGGGNSRYFNTWFENYTGNEGDAKEANGRRVGKLNNAEPKGNGAYNYRESQGTIQNSGSTVIILVDNNCGSSGEGALRGLKTLRNSMVIGSNSIGCASFGNVVNYTLPNSGIPFAYGTDLRSFSDPMENVDGKGFLPDIWCDPSHALEAVNNMLIRYNVCDEEALTKLVREILKASVKVTMEVEGDIVNVGEGFGRGRRAFRVFILADGKRVSDYEYSVKNNIGTIKKQSDGSLLLQADKAGDAVITIDYQGSSNSFRWHNSN